MVDCIHRKRWFHAKRSTDFGWRSVCIDIRATVSVAYPATYASFHQTHSPEANHSNSLDGTHLLRECGKYEKKNKK